MFPFFSFLPVQPAELKWESLWRLQCEHSYEVFKKEERERTGEEPRELLADAQSISDVPFHGAPLKTIYAQYNVLHVEPSDVLSDTEWKYEEGPCEIHDATYEGIDRSFHQWWSSQPRKAVEGDIYPRSAWSYWLGEAKYRSLVNFFPVISGVRRGCSDELTGTG